MGSYVKSKGRQNFCPLTVHQRCNFGINGEGAYSLSIIKEFQNCCQKV